MRYAKSLLAIPVALIAAALLHACGGGTDGNGGAMSNSATVTSYITDDLGGYESVVLTVNTVQLSHPSGRTCDIIQGPLEIDAAELGREQILEQIVTTTCEAGPYNRLHVELDDDVTLRETATSLPLACKFVSYFDGNLPLPNRLACVNGTCALNITGAVNLIARSHEHVALDVDLKSFEVDTGVTPCEVTLKVSPVHADGKLTAGYRKRLSGTVSNVGATTFTLTMRGKLFTVQYAGVTDQVGLQALLNRAATDGLRTSVRCHALDLTASPPVCTAQTIPAPPLKAITVKAKGSVSALLDTATPPTFTLNYGAGTTLPVNYAKAVELGNVQGTLANDASADVMLYGFDATFYLARDVEVE